MESEHQSAIVNDSWILNLVRNGYNFNKIRGETMFEEKDVEFMFEQGAKDLASLTSRINDCINQMTAIAKRLCDLKKTEARLQSIQDTIIKQKERIERRGGCCSN